MGLDSYLIRKPKSVIWPERFTDREGDELGIRPPNEEDVVYSYRNNNYIQNIMEETYEVENLEYVKLSKELIDKYEQEIYAVLDFIQGEIAIPMLEEEKVLVERLEKVPSESEEKVISNLKKVLHEDLDSIMNANVLGMNESQIVHLLALYGGRWRDNMTFEQVKWELYFLKELHSFLLYIVRNADSEDLYFTSWY